MSIYTSKGTNDRPKWFYLIPARWPSEQDISDMDNCITGVLHITRRQPYPRVFSVPVVVYSLYNLGRALFSLSQSPEWLCWVSGISFHEGLFQFRGNGDRARVCSWIGCQCKRAIARSCTVWRTEDPVILRKLTCLNQGQLAWRRHMSRSVCVGEDLKWPSSMCHVESQL